MRKLTILCLIILFTSCKAYDIEQTEPITLQAGIKNIFEALDEAADLDTRKNNGLVPSEFTVEFNLSTSKKNSANASLEIAPASIVPKIGAGWSAEVNNATGNKLTIKFRNVLFTKQDEFLANKTPEQLMEFITKLKELGLNINAL